jgi:nucleoside-diphosphate-sugar epimerase
MIKNSKILILGGAGFIGYYLAEKLSQSNEIVIIDNLFKEKKKDYFLKKLLKKKNIKFYQKDICKINPNNFIKKFHYIFDCAAILGVQKVIKENYFSLEKNIKLTLKAIEIAKKQKNLKKIIFFSSSEVYDGGGKFYNTKYPSKVKIPITLSEIFEKRTVYMASKILGEIFYINSSLPFQVNRLHNIYGPRMGYSHVVPELIKKLHSKKKTIKVFSPNHSRTFCYYEDAIKIIIRLAKSNKSTNKIFNVGNQKPEIKMKKLIKIIMKVLKIKKKIIFSRDTHNSPLRRCPDMSLTNKIVGKLQQTKIEDGILKTFYYYKTNK